MSINGEAEKGWWKLKIQYSKKAVAENLHDTGHWPATIYSLKTI